MSGSMIPPVHFPNGDTRRRRSECVFRIGIVGGLSPMKKCRVSQITTNKSSGTRK
jgi:hypothetical protein